MFIFRTFNVFFTGILFFIAISVKWVSTVSAQENSGRNLYDFAHSYNYASYLIKTKQYRLAIPEFERVYFMNPEQDSIKFFLLLAYRKTGDYMQGMRRAGEIFQDAATLSRPLALELSKMLLLTQQFDSVKALMKKNARLLSHDTFYMALNGELLSANWKQAKQLFDCQSAEMQQQLSVYSELIMEAGNVRYKKPLLAAGMSVLVPGTGKLYAGRWKDALVAFVTVGAAAFQSYRGFEKKGVNSAYGWIFGTLAIGFYSGNIYGSYKAAEMYNTDTDHRLKQKVLDILDRE